MSNYNNNNYGTVGYYEEELKQETLIAELVKEAVYERVQNPDGHWETIEDLSIAVLTVADRVKQAQKQLEEAKAKEGGKNG